MAIRNPFEVLGSAGGFFLGGPLGAEIGGSLGGAIDAGQQDPAGDTKKGLEYENEAYLAREKALWKRGKRRGLTPQEYYGSPAPGVGGPSAVGVALGNQANARKMQSRQFGVNLFENAMNRKTQLGIAKIQADAQKYSADKSAGATEGAANIQAEAQKFIAENRLKLDEKTYQMNLDLAVNKMKIQEEQLKKLVNEVATSDPQFVKMMKQLSMGVENMLTEYFQRHHGISLKDPESFTKLPKEERKQLLTAMIAMRANILPEWSFVQTEATSAFDKIRMLLENIALLAPRAEGAPGGAPSLGSSSEPYQSGMNMNYR